MGISNPTLTRNHNEERPSGMWTSLGRSWLKTAGGSNSHAQAAMLRGTNRGRRCFDEGVSRYQKPFTLKPKPREVIELDKVSYGIILTVLLGVVVLANKGSTHARSSTGEIPNQADQQQWLQLLGLVGV